MWSSLWIKQTGPSAPRPQDVLPGGNQPPWHRFQSIYCELHKCSRRASLQRKQDSLDPEDIELGKNLMCAIGSPVFCMVLMASPSQGSFWSLRGTAVLWNTSSLEFGVTCGEYSKPVREGQGAAGARNGVFPKVNSTSRKLLQGERESEGQWVKGDALGSAILQVPRRGAHASSPTLHTKHINQELFVMHKLTHLKYTRSKSIGKSHFLPRTCLRQDN